MLAWYVLDSTGSEPRPEGPFPFEHLAKLAASGGLSASSMVARAGSDRWIAAGEDRELAGLFRGAPPTEFFAPSGSASLATPGFPESSASAYSFGAAFDLAFRTFKAQWGPLVLAGLVAVAVYAAIGAPQWIMQAAGEASRDAGAAALMAMGGGCFGLVANLLVGGAVFAGMTLCGANAVAGRGNVADLFLGFKRYGNVLLAYLLVGAISMGATFAIYLGAIVAAFVVGLASGAASNGEVAIGAALVAALIVGGVLAVVATAVVFVRILFVPAIVADAQLGAIGVVDALRLNWQATRGLGWSLMALLVVVSLIAAASALLLCVGYFLIGVPLALASLGAVYTMLFRRGLMAPPAS